jgi:3-deoxy-D-manno-octulosonic-acid transferase
MALYSLLLAAVFLIGAPYWVFRMATTGRYRAGLGERLGGIPPRLAAIAATRKVVWLHAVSVGEVLAATGLVTELELAMGADWLIVVSTTTSAGQALARERLGGSHRVFFYPLDFAFAVRSWLRALRPALVVLMESELWPRMLAECRRSGIPVAVVNARVSDRSFARALKVRAIWRRLLAAPSLFLAQSGEDARRLIALGANPQAVSVTGNLKYDVRAPSAAPLAEKIRSLAAGRPIIVAGSTHGRMKDDRLSEEEMVIQGWEGAPRTQYRALLVLAPRHPQRFDEVESVVMEFSYLKATSLTNSTLTSSPDIVLLDTIGDLAAVYSIASVAFVGGSLVPRGGQNPLEPAKFGVPVIMGPSYENFRDIVSRLTEAKGIVVVQNHIELEAALADLLAHPDEAAALGCRAKGIFEQQQGATARTVAALTRLLAASAEGRQ